MIALTAIMTISSITTCDVIKEAHAPCCGTAPVATHIDASCDLRRFLPGYDETQTYELVNISVSCPTHSKTWSDMQCCSPRPLPVDLYGTDEAADAPAWHCYSGSFLSTSTVDIAKHTEPYTVVPARNDVQCQQLLLGFSSLPANTAGYVALQNGVEDYLMYAREQNLLDGKCVQALYLDHYYKVSNYVGIMSEFAQPNTIPPNLVLTSPAGTGEMELDLLRAGRRYQPTSGAASMKKVGLAGWSQDADGTNGGFSPSNHPFFSTVQLTGIYPGYGDVSIEPGTYPYAFTGAPNIDDMANSVMAHMVSNKCPTGATVETPCLIDVYTISAPNSYGAAVIKAAKSAGKFKMFPPRPEDVKPGSGGNHEAMVCDGAYSNPDTNAFVLATYTQESDESYATTAKYPHVYVHLYAGCANAYAQGDLTRGRSNADAIYLHTYGGDDTWGVDTSALASKIYVHPYWSAALGLGTSQVSGFAPVLLDNAFRAYMQTKSGFLADGKSSNYFMGIFIAATFVQALRQSGTAGLPLSAVAFRSAYESLNITASEVTALGLEGNFPDLAFASADHKGRTAAYISTKNADGTMHVSGG